MTASYTISMDLADPCHRCGRAHDFVVVDGMPLPCPVPRWTTRLTRRLIDALAAEARRRRASGLNALAVASLVGRR